MENEESREVLAASGRHRRKERVRAGGRGSAQASQAVQLPRTGHI